MSTLKVDAIRHNSATSDAITTHSDGTCTAKITGMTGGGGLSHRNLIVNGAMDVAQRGQVTGVSNGFGGPDRFRFQSNYSAVTMSQSTDVPTGQGFAKSLKLDVTTAGGDSNADTYTQVDYRFEGQELTRLKYGTSDAETTTISFWIKSPKAGIHWVRLYGDELSGNAFISRKYTVSSANTWQKVILSFPGYTGSGFNNDNTTGMRISIYFAQGSAYSSGTAQADDGGWLSWTESAAVRSRNTVGQVNCFDSTSNDIYITGVQFEVGDTATSFEHRSYSDEITRCSRYLQMFHVPTNDSYRASNITATVHGTGGGVYLNVAFTHPMRVAPSITVDGAFGGNVFTGSWSGATLSSITAEYSTDALTTLGFNGITSASVTGSHTTGLTGQIYTANNGSNDAALIYSAEL